MKDTVAFIFGLGMVLNAALFVPQAVHLWRTKTAQGVSILSFAGFNTLQAIGALHGYFEHDYALMIGMLASLLTCGSVTVLAVRYGATRSPASGSATTRDPGPE
jgi:MtN3 and saliva related transmembrane protein